MMAFARRLGWSLVVVWSVVSIAFAVNTLLPGDPARMVAGPQARPADVARIAGPLSFLKSAMVLKSGANRPVSHIISTLRCVSRSSRRLEAIWLM